MTTPAGSTGRLQRKASFGLAATLLAVPGAVVLLDSRLAAMLFTAELTVVLLVLTAAVFGPCTTSERAFRLLRWMTGTPEPDAPQQQTTGCH